MVDVAVFYGANRSVAEREMQDALQFEKGLDKVNHFNQYICALWSKSGSILIRNII